MSKRTTGDKTPPTAPAPDERWHDAEELRWAARHWATRMSVKLARVQVRQMTNKWASISTAGRLTFNSELLDVPKPLGEFVIVHELVHLLAPNHGPVFKSFLHAYLPDWKQRERELRQRTSGTSKDKSTARKGVHRRGGQQSAAVAARAASPSEPQ